MYQKDDGRLKLLNCHALQKTVMHLDFRVMLQLWSKHRMQFHDEGQALTFTLWAWYKQWCDGTDNTNDTPAARPHASGTKRDTTVVDVVAQRTFFDSEVRSWRFRRIRKPWVSGREVVKWLCAWRIIIKGGCSWPLSRVIMGGGFSSIFLKIARGVFKVLS